MRDTSKDIFVRHNSGLKLSAITHFQVQNEVMLIALNGQTLCQVRLQNFKQTYLKLPIELHDRVAHLHLDYNGLHGLLSTVGGENFYINMRNSSLKPLKRLKGFVVSAVAWNLEFSKENETGFILLGTIKGTICELNITSTGSLNNFKQLHANFTENELPISGMHLRQFGDNVNTASKYLLLICVPNRLYCLAGQISLHADLNQQSQQIVGTVWSSVMVDQNQETILQSLFNFKAKKPLEYLTMDKMTKEISSSIPNSIALHSSNEIVTEHKFAWVTAMGLSVGTIDTTKFQKGDMPDGRKMLQIDFDLTHHRSEGRLDYPLDVCLTDYHLLLLFTRRLSAISLYDRTLAFEDYYMGLPRIIGMTKDSCSQLIWVFFDSIIYKYRPNEENRNVWRIFMDQGEFARAMKIANQLKNKQPFQLIIKKQAEKFINEKNFVAAAESLAQSNEPFDKLVLLMLKDGPSSRNGLKRFLELKLNQMHQNMERLHRDMLVLWLLEIQLAELAELRRNVNEEMATTSIKYVEEKDTTITETFLSTLNIKETEIKRLKEQFYCFLNRPNVFEVVSDNRVAVYKMISSHVDIDVQLHIAQKLHDVETIIKIYLMQKEFKAILEIITTEWRTELLYQYAPELIVELPEELIDVLQLKFEKGLDLLKLLPAFQKCFDPALTNRFKMVDSIFTFIEKIATDTAPSSFIDFSINLYATFRPRELLYYLKRIGTLNKFQGCNISRFDMCQAMRICTEHGLSESRVFLLCIQGFYEEAVKLALDISVDLAKKCAKEIDEEIEFCEKDSFVDYIIMDKGVDTNANCRSSQIMTEMRKRAWLEIAKYIIQSGAPITQCLSLLTESRNAIRIQDILVYFPEFKTIEHIKEPLCASLNESSKEIKQFQREIRDATEMAEELRREIEDNRTRPIVIRVTANCFLCNEILLQRPIIAFICRHFFHRDCLETKIKTISNEYDNLLNEERVLKKELQLATNQSNGKHKNTSNREDIVTKKLEPIRNRLKELLCGDCPLCGMQTIEEIDKPFFDDPEQYLEQLKLWIP